MSFLSVVERLVHSFDAVHNHIGKMLVVWPDMSGIPLKVEQHPAELKVCELAGC